MRIMSKEKIRLNALEAINEIEENLTYGNYASMCGLRWEQIGKETQQDILETWLGFILLAFGYSK